MTEHGTLEDPARPAAGAGGSSSGPASGGGEPPVRLAIPAAPRFLRLARLTAAGIASDLGFTIEEIEDLRIAVDEVCAVLIERATEGALLELEYRADRRGLSVSGRCPADSAAPPELHAVARELLGMTADDYRIDAVDGVRTFELRKSPGTGP